MNSQRLQPASFFDIAQSEDPLTENVYVLKQEYLESIYKAQDVQTPDIDLVDGLLRLIHNDLEAYGTSGGTLLNDDQLEFVIRVTRRIGDRTDIVFPKLPFRTFSAFGDYWRQNNMSGSWAARREYLNKTFAEVEEKVLEARERAWDEQLALPISPHEATGWPEIDAEIIQMRRKFATAATDQDHSAIGNAAVRIFQMLSDTVFDIDRHTDPSFPAPTPDQTKIRLELIVRKELAGPDNAATRKLANATIELAHRVKHSKSPSRRDTGISADAVILLTNIIRRITT